ncbi:MAG: hypothetical protein ACOC0Y_02140 [Spirochaetota bacterium]
MRKLVATLLLLVLAHLGAYATNITIPKFHLLTRGALEDGLFVLATQADVDVEFGGGYKFGGELSFSIETDSLEEPSIPGATYEQDVISAALRERLGLSSARVIVRDLFGLPLNASYFIGEYDRILNGDLFPTQFGSQIVASDFRGLLYFPDGTVYDGVHALDGTGLALTAASIAPWLYLEGAVYQDAYLGPGFYSADVRAAFNTERFKAETFFGSSFPQAQYGLYRAGILLYYSTGQGGEFLTQVGIPRWAPVTDGALNIDDFYFLFEPRVHIGIVSIVLTLFRHPEYYVQAPTGQRSATDIIVRLIAGDVQENTISGGLESGVRLRPSSADDQLQASVSPSLSISSSGVIWDFKTSFHLFPWNPSDLFEGYVGIRTQF